MASLNDTAAAFAVDGERLVCLIGGGGKTTLMARLSHDLAARGRRVITTTTTRIRHPDRGIVVIEPTLDRLVTRLGDALHVAPEVTAAKEHLPESKLRGLTADEVDHLAGLSLADTIVVEADGAAGRPLKAHADHEPVIPSSTGLVIAVVGTDCLGTPVDDRFVHRSELFATRLGLPPGHIVTAQDVAAILLHPLGYLRRVPPGARVAVLLNKADDSATEAEALACAKTLHRADQALGSRLERIVVGSLLGSGRLVRAV